MKKRGTREATAVLHTPGLLREDGSGRVVNVTNDGAEIVSHPGINPGLTRQDVPKAEH